MTLDRGLQPSLDGSLRILSLKSEISAVIGRHDPSRWP